MFCFDHHEIINQFNTTLYLGLFKQKKKKKKKNPTANQFDLKSGKKKITSPTTKIINFLILKLREKKKKKKKKKDTIKYVVKCKP